MGFVEMDVGPAHSLQMWGMALKTEFILTTITHMSPPIV